MFYYCCYTSFLNISVNNVRLNLVDIISKYLCNVTVTDYRLHTTIVLLLISHHPFEDHNSFYLDLLLTAACKLFVQVI